MINEKYEKAVRFMKRYTVFLIALALILFLWGCKGEGEKVIRERERSSYDFLIMTLSGGIEEQTARMVGAELEDMGYTWALKTKKPEYIPKEIKGAVFVGIESMDIGDFPSVRCTFDMNARGDENTLSPCLSSGEMARAATLLLADAQHFTVFSAEKGATDVQDACDVFDLCGVDYRAETLEEGEFAQCFSISEKWGSDALLLPSAELSGRGVELFGAECAVFAVGEGEPVRGALASFCIDTEKLARDTARLLVSRVTGEEVLMHTESYYILCLDRALCEKYSADITAASEDFKVVLVD